MTMVDTIKILDLDEKADEIHGGKWVSYPGLVNWLNDAIAAIDTAQKVRKCEWRSAMKAAYKSLKKNMK